MDERRNICPLPKISVIVPVYNIECYIGKCIESIVKQTYLNLQIILVDDGSVDASGQICDLYAEKDNRITVIHKKNGGLVSARKAGMKVVTGEYVGYVDGDDWVDEKFFQDFYDSIRKTDAEIAIGGFSHNLFDKSWERVNSIPAGKYEKDVLSVIKSKTVTNDSVFRRGLTTYLWNKLFRSEAVYQYQMLVDNDITIGEDAAVVYPALMNANNIIVTENCAYHYRQRQGSMLQNVDRQEKEVLQIKRLYGYFQNLIDKKIVVGYDFRNQIDSMILGMFTICSGGFISDKETVVSLSPLANRVVIYGAGAFGQHLISRLQSIKGMRVVAWLDADYWEYRRYGFNVDAPESILDLEFDCVFLALADIDVANNVKERYVSMGIETDKLVVYDYGKEEVRGWLERYLKI